MPDPTKEQLQLQQAQTMAKVLKWIFEMDDLFDDGKKFAPEHGSFNGHTQESKFNCFGCGGTVTKAYADDEFRKNPPIEHEPGCIFILYEKLYAMKDSL